MDGVVVIQGSIAVTLLWSVVFWAENSRRCHVGSEVAHNTELLEDLTNKERKKKQVLGLKCIPLNIFNYQLFKTALVMSGMLMKKSCVQFFSLQLCFNFQCTCAENTSAVSSSGL